MKKYIIFATLLVLVLIGISTAISFNSKNYITTLKYTHSHTKAICDSKNFCQDYEIFCENKDVMYMIPITGAAIQFPEDWQDPRDEEIKNGVC